MGIKVCLKVNLMFALIISLFSKIALLSVINGNINDFILVKIIIHCALVYSIGQENLLLTVFLFVLDITLYALYVVFEFIFVIAMLLSSALFGPDSQQAIIGIIVCLTIASIDLMILVMVGISTEQMKHRTNDSSESSLTTQQPDYV
uniref:Uncharacterized protein n=1 Tax=Tetranychus urticae TaxID=32264 RepID=T1KEF1_TETUR